MEVNNQSFYKHCNTSLGLVLSNNECVCSDGYSLSGGVCAAVCGDGKVYGEDCDDGNTDDGDGCSSACGVEKNYNCQNGTVSSPSECTYFGDVTLNVSWMGNTGSVNEGVIALSADPALSNIAKMDMTQLVDFRVGNLSVPFKSWTYSNGEIQLFFDYDRTLEWGNGTLSATLDSKYVRTLTPASQTQSFFFTVDSRHE